MSPNGTYAIVPATLTLVAWALSVSSTCLCTFATRNVQLTGQLLIGLEETAFVFLQDNQGAGFWGWESEGTCYSYEINQRRPNFDIQFSMSSIFTTMTDALGGLVMVACALGIFFPIDPSHYSFLAYSLLLVGCLDLATLSFLTSEVCGPDFFNYAVPNHRLSRFISSSCGLGVGAILALVAGLCWLLAAAVILATDLAEGERSNTGDKGGAEPMTLYENSEGGSIISYAQRREATEKRYEQVFGGDSSFGEEYFESSVTQKASLLQEVSDDEDETEPERLRREEDEEEWRRQEEQKVKTIMKGAKTRHEKKYGPIQEEFHDEDDYQEDQEGNDTDLPQDASDKQSQTGESSQDDSTREDFEDYDGRYDDEQDRDDRHGGNESELGNELDADSSDAREERASIGDETTSNGSRKVLDGVNPPIDPQRENPGTNPFDNQPSTNPFDESQNLPYPPEDERGPNPYDDESYEGSQARRSYRSTERSQANRSFESKPMGSEASRFSESRSTRSQVNRSHGKSYREVDEDVTSLSENGVLA